jgi:hypothetical protein
MGNKQLKRYRRAVKKAEDKVVGKFVADHWDSVIVSAVRMIRRFKFKTRFQIAMTILFKPDKIKQPQKVKPASPRGDGAKVNMIDDDAFQVK